jgi:hypothetical protein
MVSMLALPSLSHAAASPPQDKAVAAARVKAVMQFASAQCARLARDGAAFFSPGDIPAPAEVDCGGSCAIPEGSFAPVLLGD